MMLRDSITSLLTFRLRELPFAFCVVVLLGSSLLGQVAFGQLAEAPTERVSNVGIPTTLEDLILPGSELRVRPLDRNAPVVVRIANTIRHGDAHRYQIVYYGLEPGTHGLTEYLERVDGSPLDLAAISVVIQPLLPAGQIEPSRLASEKSDSIGGYRLMMWLAGLVWVIGLLALLFIGRGRNKHNESADQGPTLADRLRPIVEDAMHGRLTDRKQAELERLLLTYWRQRLNLDNVKAAEAMSTLREHEEAGVLLRQLESWLHKPAAQREQMDVGELLKPYRNVRETVAAS